MKLVKVLECHLYLQVGTSCNLLILRGFLCLKVVRISVNVTFFMISKRKKYFKVQNSRLYRWVVGNKMGSERMCNTRLTVMLEVGPCVHSRNTTVALQAIDTLQVGRIL